MINLNLTYTELVKLWKDFLSWKYKHLVIVLLCIVIIFFGYKFFQKAALINQQTSNELNNSTQLQGDNNAVNSYNSTTSTTIENKIYAPGNNGVVVGTLNIEVKQNQWTLDEEQKTELLKIDKLGKVIIRHFSDTGSITIAKAIEELLINNNYNVELSAGNLIFENTPYNEIQIKGREITVGPQI